MARIALTQAEKIAFAAGMRDLPSYHAAQQAQKDTIGQRDPTPAEHAAVTAYGEELRAYRLRLRIALGAGGTWYKTV